MAPETRARIAFDTWLEAQLAAGQSKKAIADALSVTPQALLQWRERHSRPTLDVRDRIFLVTGVVQPGDWDTDEEVREREEQLLRARQFGSASTGTEG